MSLVSKLAHRGETHLVTPRLDDFFSTFQDANPFVANRVTEPSRYDVDVPGIHADGFDRLTRLAGQTLGQKAGVGVALLGGAGVGKSHLLSRLYRWANETTEGGGPRACYVYLQNVLADPDRLPRYMLKYVVSRLTEGGRGPLYQTPLYRFVDIAIRHALKSAGVKLDKVENDIRGSLEAYRAYFERATNFRAAYDVLFQFWRFARSEKANEPGRRHLALSAVTWLSGDEIDPVFAAKLGFKADEQEPTLLHDDHEVEQVFLALAHLAQVSRQPLIVCVDQFENLDPDKLKPMVRFFHALLDQAVNLLLIVSGVKQTLLKYREESIIPEAAWDRIAQYKIEMKRITPGDARKILEARLERFHEPFLGVDAVRRHVQDDTLFPLGRTWLEARLGDGLEFRPRDILTWARDAWDEEQMRLAGLGGEVWLRGWPHPTTDHDRSGSGVSFPEISPSADPQTRDAIEARIDATVDRKIAEQIAQHRLQPGSLPPDAGNLAGLVEMLLGQCQGVGLPYTFREVERMKKSSGRLPPYDLKVRERRESDGKDVTTGVVFITNIGKSASDALRRLLEDNKPPDHRLLVTDHERRPLQVGIQGAEYYKDLEKLGPGRFEHLRINFEQYAGLDALREVVSMARSGDLEIESPPGTPCPVSEAEVIASHHRKDRYRAHPLLRPLLTEDAAEKPSAPAEVVALDEKDVRQYVMAQLAWMMGSKTQAIARGYVAAMTGQKVSYEDAWPQIKAIAGRMHVEGLVHATPHDDDLLLLLRK